MILDRIKATRDHFSLAWWTVKVIERRKKVIRATCTPVMIGSPPALAASRRLHRARKGERSSARANGAPRLPARRSPNSIANWPPPPARPACMNVHRLWGGLMRACGGRGAGLRGSARFRALEQHELAREALRMT